jgi:hypothetical protein
MNFKLALVAAAVVGAASTAQAADLAKKAPAAANYVKVCDAYGAGFFYIPGSDTCLKIGGYVQAQYNMYWASKNASLSGGVYGWHRGQNGISTAARAVVQLDARSNTEMGLLRSFIELEINNTSYGVSTGVNLNKAFIQFGGLTAGRATSFFDFFNGDYVQSAYFEASHSDSNVNVLAYTFSFGNGITATLSVEDPSTDNNTARRVAYPGLYGGVHTPDLVANVNVAQAWGSAQVMGVLHDDVSSVSGVNSKVGFAVGAGVKVNLPALGASDQVALQVAYSKGALGYLSTGFGGTSPDFGTSGVVGSSVYQNSAWAVAVGFTHAFTKTISGNLEASYAQYRSDRGLAAIGDFNQWDVIANVAWSPVAGLAITPELEYRNVDYSSAANAGGALDASALVGVLRIRRTF